MRYRSSSIPFDPHTLKDYIVRNYAGYCRDIGCEDASDPEFGQYVGDELAGRVDKDILDQALLLLKH